MGAFLIPVIIVLVFIPLFALPGLEGKLFVPLGIAFELDGQSSTSSCRALVVHLPGQPVSKIYLAMPVYLKEVPVRK